MTIYELNVAIAKIVEIDIFIKDYVCYLDNQCSVEFNPCEIWEQGWQIIEKFEVNKQIVPLVVDEFNGNNTNNKFRATCESVEGYGVTPLETGIQAIVNYHEKLYS